jgi:lipid-A-disaccharide synthase
VAESSSKRALTIALVAGEASGDQLGAALIARLKVKYPRARFVGIGGKQMQATDMEVWWDANELAVMGLFEVLSHLPRLLKIRRELTRRLSALKPNVFIGIDAPDFNLGMEIKLRKRGIRTVHYVSPTVWAWREKRVRKIKRAVDLVLCLFPFEPAFFNNHGVPATYVGHPMADQISPEQDPCSARSALGLEPDSTTIALLPGSRVGEVSRLAEPMLEAARLLSSQRSGLQFVSAMANKNVRAVFEKAMEKLLFSQVKLVDQEPRKVMAAADVVMCASGTATLETMLVNRPMVMTYQVSASTYQLAKLLSASKPDLFSLPNILAGEALVPELIQQYATGENLVREVSRWLDDEESRNSLRDRFLELHAALRCDASEKAAEAISNLLGLDGA